MLVKDKLSRGYKSFGLTENCTPEASYFVIKLIDDKDDEVQK